MFKLHVVVFNDEGLRTDIIEFASQHEADIAAKTLASTNSNLRYTNIIVTKLY